MTLQLPYVHILRFKKKTGSDQARAALVGVKLSLTNSRISDLSWLP
jgi:hypothetical protein